MNNKELNNLIKFRKVEKQQDTEEKQELKDINIIHTYNSDNLVNSIVLIKNNLARIMFIDYLDNQKAVYNMFDYGAYWLFIVKQIKERQEGDNKNND